MPKSQEVAEKVCQVLLDELEDPNDLREDDARWIFQDEPRLSATYPRIRVKHVESPAISKKCLNSGDQLLNMRFDIKIYWMREEKHGYDYAEQGADDLANSVWNIIKDHKSTWIDMGFVKRLKPINERDLQRAGDDRFQKIVETEGRIVR